jgi:GMP synthase (glutamine-hydrolysing)
MGKPQHIIKKKYGDFSQWFIRAYKNIDSSILVDGFDADDVDLPDLLECDGVILSGAEENVGDELPWRKHFDPILKSLMDHKQPVLGVCFGHQYLASYLGGTVVREEGAGQFGNFVVDLTEAGQADPLFKRIPSSAFFLQSHYEMVIEAPKGAVVLASDDTVPVQAFRWGDSLWGVQFHPEMTPGINMSIIDELDMEDEVKEELKLEAQNVHDGLRVLENFAHICAERSERNLTN